MGEMEDRLDAGTIAKLNDAAPAGRSKTILSDIELSDAMGAMMAAYNLLVARVEALEAAS
jgi:hypothetical protein